MFASNQKISIRQIYRLFVFDLIGISTLVLPGKLAYFSGSDGLWAIVIGGVLSSLYLWYLGKVVAGMETDLTTYIRQRLPRWLQVVILLFLGLHSLWTAGFGAYIFADVMKRGLVPEESYTLVLLLVLLVAGYAVHGGIESRARIYEVLFSVCAVALAIMFVIAAFDIQWDYVGPFLQSAPVDMVNGGILVLFCFMPLFFVLFFPEYVAAGKEKKMVRAVFCALWSAVLVLALLYLILLGSFGSGALATMRYPAVTLMSNIHLRSSFLKRFDAFMLGIWFFTLFALINLFLFYGTNLLQCVCMSGQKSTSDKKEDGTFFRVQGNLVWLIVGMVLTFVMAELFYYKDWTGIFLNYVCYVGMPVLILLPGLVLVIGRARRA